MGICCLRYIYISTLILINCMGITKDVLGKFCIISAQIRAQLLHIPVGEKVDISDRFLFPFHLFRWWFWFLGCWCWWCWCRCFWFWGFCCCFWFLDWCSWFWCFWFWCFWFLDWCCW